MDDAQRRANRWNKRHAGKPASKLGKDGYHWTWLDGHRYRTDHLIWKMQTGNDPIGDIVHVNGDNADNRWDNLRDSGATQ
jgi:hypothetical protein